MSRWLLWWIELNLRVFSKILCAVFGVDESFSSIMDRAESKGVVYKCVSCFWWMKLTRRKILFRLKTFVCFSVCPSIWSSIYLSEWDIYIHTYIQRERESGSERERDKERERKKRKQRDRMSKRKKEKGREKDRQRNWQTRVWFLGEFVFDFLAYLWVLSVPGWWLK